MFWLISLIPDGIFIWITYALFAIGAVLYVASKLVSWIPLMMQYRLPAELLGIVLLIAGAYLFGGYGTEMMWRQRVNDLQKQVAEAEAKSQQVNTVIETQVVTKIKVVKETVYVNKEIIKEVVGKQLDAQCTIPVSAISLHDSAGRNEVSGGAGSADGTASNVKASELLATVVENYGTYYEMRERLLAWQDWYTKQKHIFETIK